MAFWLENAYSCQFQPFFELFTHKIVTSLFWAQKECNSHRNTHLSRITRTNCSNLLIPSCDNKQKKRKYTRSTNHWHITPLWRSRPWTDWYAVYGINSRPWRNNPYQMSCRSVIWFSQSEHTQKCHFVLLGTTVTTVMHYRTHWFRKHLCVMQFSWHVQKFLYVKVVDITVHVNATCANVS